MSRPTIALLTDFGTRDHYVAAMKGVALAICPDATLVDITHDVPPQDVQAASYTLGACYRCFPPGTVFLVVVDPGVGSSRRALAAETGEYRCVAPDNGVLTDLMLETPARRVVELSERRYARATVSRTFEGRDRFAPAAAWLAKGVDLSALGRPLPQYHLLAVPRPSVEEDRIVGSVRHVDRFGNLITDIDRRTFERVARLAAGGARLQIRIASAVVERLVATYADAAAGELCALIGSSEHLEVAASHASAAAQLGTGTGASVVVTVEPGEA